MMDKAAMKFELIYEITLDPDNPYTIQQLCSLNHVSRSGYYNWLSSREAHAQREEQDRADFELILKATKKQNFLYMDKMFSYFKNGPNKC